VADTAMGERLRELREAAGLSQAQLAKASGVPVGTLWGWQYGRRKPLLETAVKVARALGVHAEDLVPEGPPRKRKGKK
jgi:transcriptional regulator with XRE-family HTH domain